MARYVGPCGTKPALQPRCVFVGPFPEPVHGQSVATLTLSRILKQRRFHLSKYDDSGAFCRRFANALETMRAIIARKNDYVYCSVNSKYGLILTIAYVTITTVMRKPLFLHHHSFRYIGNYNIFMQLLAIAATKTAIHICNCPQMEILLRKKYKRIEKTLPLSNIGSVDSALHPASRPDRPLTIGHLSNLTEEKGIGRVLRAFDDLSDAGIDARLEIAGPAGDDFARAALKAAESKYGPRFSYHGPVYGKSKQAFFDRIDIFAFPSLYPTETQGIVNLEALACGKPVIAFDQCCIGDDIGKTGGVAVPKSADFGAELVKFSKRFLRDSAQIAALARQRYDELEREYQKQIDNLCDRMSIVTQYN